MSFNPLRIGEYIPRVPHGGISRRMLQHVSIPFASGNTFLAIAAALVLLLKCKVTKIELDADPRLLLDGARTSASSDSKEQVEKFQAWVKKMAGFEFWQAGYIKSYRSLHHWQDGSQIRYYPINFADYGWLPGTAVSNTKGDPQGQRPPAMKRA